MSLDLYLNSKTSIKKRGTGVFVRRNGQTVELETIEDVKVHFPHHDTSQLQEREEETECVWNGNVTHNLCEMAQHVIVGSYNLYQLLWHPEDNGFEVLSEMYRELVVNGLAYMLSHRYELELYNPSNGWGSYDSFLWFVQSYCEALSKWDGKEEISIYASR